MDCVLSRSYYFFPLFVPASSKHRTVPAVTLAGNEAAQPDAMDLYKAVLERLVSLHISGDNAPVGSHAISRVVYIMKDTPAQVGSFLKAVEGLMMV